MTDRVSPSAKPNGGAAPRPPPAARVPAVSTQPLPTVRPPPNKAANLYNPNLRRPAAAPRHHQKHRDTFTFRRCCCLTVCWLILILIAVLLLGVIALAAVYTIYHPVRPAFTVTSLKLLQLNLATTPPDDSTHLTAKMNLTLAVKNPNDKRILFTYDPLAISMNSRSVGLADVTSANFVSVPQDIKVIHTMIGPKSQVVDGDDLNLMQSDLKKRIGLPMEIVVDTMVAVKMDNWKLGKFGIRVKCEGIHGAEPKRKGKVVIPAVANVAQAKCKVGLRLKIWKITI